MTTNTTTSGDGIKRVGPRPDQAAIVDAYAHFVRLARRPDGWDAVALLSANLEAATILMIEEHSGCTTPACAICIPLRHATAYLFAFNLWVARS